MHVSEAKTRGGEAIEWAHRFEMAERSGVIEKQARDGARRSEAKSSVGEEIGAPPGVNNGEPRSERVKSIWSGFTNEKGLRGEQFEHISGF